MDVLKFYYGHYYNVCDQLLLLVSATVFIPGWLLSVLQNEIIVYCIHFKYCNNSMDISYTCTSTATPTNQEGFVYKVIMVSNKCRRLIHVYMLIISLAISCVSMIYTYV